MVSRCVSRWMSRWVSRWMSEMVIDRCLDGWRCSEVPGLGPPGVDLAFRSARMQAEPRMLGFLTPWNRKLAVEEDPEGYRM